jgi:PAS domain S-box-containing protein
VLKEMGGLPSIVLEVEPVAGAVPEDGDVSRATAPYHAVYRLRAKGGEVHWVEDRTYPWTDEKGTPVGLLGVLVDVTPRRREQEAERDRQRRQLDRQRALTALSTFEGSAGSLLPQATAEAAHLLGVERVSVWVRSAAGYFRCASMCAAGREVSGRTPPLHYGDLGNGRGVLEAHRVYAVPDLRAVDTGSEFLDGHYAEFDIQALLAAPMRREGEVHGFLACEHVGAPRAWSAEEREFAAALADLLALALERQRRVHVERALRESEERYRAVSELAADYAYGIRVDARGVGTPDWATRAFERMTGHTFERLTTAGELIRTVVHPEDQGRVAAAQRRLYAGEPCDLIFRIRDPKGEERWIRHRSRPAFGPDGRVRYVYATGRDVTDRVRAERELQAAAAQAQEARALAEDTLRRKGAFVAAMSHEIRTPLTGIIGFAEVLADEVEGVHAEFAALIAASSQRLLSTVNSVLDLARLESGEVRLETERLDLVREVRQAVELLRPIAQQRGLALTLDTPPSLEAELHAACLNRVVNNLVGNALKFTDAGAVTVTVVASDEAVSVAVADTGAGIDASFLPHLFDEFKQESSGLGRQHEGSGLGLTITRGLVELMGGRIAVESEKGVGTTFTVTLPLAPHREETESAGAAPPDDGLEYVSLADLFEHPTDEPGPLLPDPLEEPARYALRSLLGAGAEPEAADAVSRGDGQDVEGAPLPLWASGGDSESGSPYAEPRPRLLLVEDHDETRHLLQRMLRGTYDVSAVADARTALDLLSRERFDLLVLDIHLGGRQTGADVLRVARTLPGYARTPAVAVTAYALPGDREGFLEGGFDGYVSKPFTAEVILAALAEAHRA